MRIVIVYFDRTSGSKTEDVVKALVKGVSGTGAGHTIDAVCAFNADTLFRLTPYDYVTVVMPCQGLFSVKVSPKVGEFLANSGTITGKKSAAIVVSTGLRAETTCRRLMKAMEHEGMFVDYFDVVKNPAQAAYIASRLG